MSLLLLFRQRSTVGTAPAVTVLPVVTSTWVEGTSASTTTGIWSGSTPQNYAYQWYRGLDVGGSRDESPISGATASTYSLTNADVGWTLRVRVTASNAYGTATAVSATGSVVTAAGTPVVPPVTSRESWRYVLCDSAGLAVDELLAFDRSLSVGVSKVATAGFRLRSDDSLWGTVNPGVSMLKIYNSAGVLVFYGPVITAEEVGSGGGAVTTKYTAADLMWRLGKRIIGAVPSPLGGELDYLEALYDVAFINTDSGVIAHSLLQTESGMRSGVSPGLRESFVPRTITFRAQKILDAITELGAIAGSYEWALRYSDLSTAAPNTFLDLEAQLGGDLSSTVFFEYGLGKNNCSGYTRSVSVENLANQMILEGPTSDGTQRTLSSADAASQTTYGLYQDYLAFGAVTAPLGIAPNDLLLDLALAHIAARKSPREVVQLTPFPLLSPRFLVDWHIGDVVTARVAVGTHLQVDGQARIWGADISIGENGNETPTLLLVPE
jgi:hypothetical protein